FHVTGVQTCALPILTRTQQPGRVAHRRADESADQDLRTYVLDTSVLLSDPRAFFRFAEHSVVIPVVVISELEGKRHDPEIGYFADRKASCRDRGAVA